MGVGETLRLPDTQQSLVRFWWNIGHTIRPNGEVLVGIRPCPFLPI